MDRIFQKWSQKLGRGQKHKRALLTFVYEAVSLYPMLFFDSIWGKDDF